VSPRGSLLLVLVAATVLAGVEATVYSLRDGALTWLLLVALGGGALALAHTVSGRRRRLGGLRRQFTLAIAIALGQLVVAVAAGAALMFVATRDAVFALSVVAFAGIVAARAAQLFARGVLADIENLRGTLVAVGEGMREPVAAPASEDELAELAAAANAAIVKLAAAETARGDLIAAVSHDLRTPITSLKLLAEAIDDGIVDEDTRRRYVRQMIVHIRALSTLIDDLFELTRLEAADLRWSLQRVRLDELVGETVDAMRVQADARRVRVRTELPPSLEPAAGEPQQLQRVLFNLIQNAIRHTPADGSVTVSAQSAAGHVEIEVADTGAGIAPAERERVFEPFFRGGPDTARTRDGAGLGLAIARAIVEAHGGRIWIEDAAYGTRVRFSLPRAR
jgi:signal transduction histidine kinase